MGALVNGKCFTSNALAADDFFSSKDPSFTSGTTSYVSWYEKGGPSAVWQIKRQSISSTGVVSNLTASTATVPTFPVCDESGQFADGLALGWLVATVMVFGWSLAQIRKAAR